MQLDWSGLDLAGAIAVYNAAQKIVVSIAADEEGNGDIQTYKGKEVGELPDFKNP